jgi:hypothetical protein
MQYVGNQKEYITEELLNILKNKQGDRVPIWDSERGYGHQLLEQITEQGLNWFGKDIPEQYFHIFNARSKDMQDYNFVLPKLPKIGKYAQAGLDFINFAGPTYSIKVQAISFFNLLKTNYKLPKVLVMEYAPEIGYTFYNNGNFVCTNTPFLKHLDGHDKITTAYKSLLDTDFFIQEATVYRNMLIGTCKRLGIKFVELSFNTTDQFVIDNNIMAIDSEYKGHNISTELARDVRLHDGNYSAHPGISIHQDISSQILKLL